MFCRIFVGLLLLILRVSAQVLLCPDTFPEECECLSYSNGPVISCVTIPMRTWDIQATFDAISDAFNNTDEAVSSVTMDFARVITPAQKVPAHSISTLKTQRLTILAYNKYTRIDPDAFSGTHSTTDILTIYNMHFEDSEEAFQLFNNFHVLYQLKLETGITLSQIPAHAFDANLQSLEYISISDAGLQSIGDLAFAQLPNVQSIALDGNDLTLANISDTAFTFAKTGVFMYLYRNPGITYLPEEKFGNYLRGNQNTLGVGCDFCFPKHLLECDERIDWICDAGVTRVNGYLCAEAAYVDIYDYCEQKFGNTPLYRRNLEEGKKIQNDDRLRHEILKTAEDFVHPFYAINKSNYQNRIHV